MSINYNALAISDGSGEPAKATVQDARVVGSTTITVDTTTNWPTGTFIAITGTLLATGKLDPTTAQVFYGTASGTTITITSFASGYTDKGNAINDVVVLKPTTEWANAVGSVIGAPMQIPQASTGQAATLQANGSDTNIDLKLEAKGTGKLDFGTYVGAGVLSQTNSGTAGGTIYYLNLGGLKLLWLVGGSCATGSTATLVYPTSFFTTVQFGITGLATAAGTNAVYTPETRLGGTTSCTIAVTAGSGAGTEPINTLIIGT